MHNYSMFFTGTAEGDKALGNDLMLMGIAAIAICCLVSWLYRRTVAASNKRVAGRMQTRRFH